jgi:hypothetical protein
VVADWPIEWRERWGRRANALEEENGLSWRDAETQAFVEVWNQFRTNDPSLAQKPGDFAERRTDLEQSLAGE